MESPINTLSTMVGKITALILDKHLHPISVHGPNGIIPMAVLFLVLAVLLQWQSFGSAAYLSMIFVLLSMPPGVAHRLPYLAKEIQGGKNGCV